MIQNGRMRVLVAALVTVTACGTVRAVPMPTFGENTPDDLRALVTDVFAATVDAFPDRQDCLAGVVVTGAWELDDRARYVPDRREIVVRIPATAPQLEVSLVHELAHHLEAACPLGVGVESAFKDAQGLDPDADWHGGDSWETTPAEQWASAVVVYVLGRADTQARIVVSPVAMDVVAAWAGRS